MPLNIFNKNFLQCGSHKITISCSMLIDTIAVYSKELNVLSISVVVLHYYYENDWMTSLLHERTKGREVRKF